MRLNDMKEATNADKCLVTALICGTALIFLLFDDIVKLKAERDKTQTCARQGMEVKTSHYDVKTNVIRTECM